MQFPENIDDSALELISNVVRESFVEETLVVQEELHAVISELSY